MFLTVLEICVVATLCYMLISQIVIPISKGTMLFPFLRKTGKLTDHITSRKTELSDEELLAQMKELDTKITEKKKARESK